MPSPLSVELESATGECGGCGRAFSADRARCFYCGWEPGRPDSGHGSVVPEQEFHQGATLWRFVFASLALGPLAVWLVLEARADGDVAFLALAVTALLLGPGVLAVQLFRRLTGTVETTPDGLNLAGGELLRWPAIEHTEIAGGLDGSNDCAGDLGKLVGRRRGVTGLLLGLSGIGLMISLLLAPLFVVMYVFVPAVSLLTPLHTRVIVHRAGGRRLVLHDLEDALGFTNAVNGKLAAERLLHQLSR